jgi:hypothetical protein
MIIIITLRRQRFIEIILGVVHIDSDSLGSYSRKPKSGGNGGGQKLAKTNIGLKIEVEA